MVRAAASLLLIAWLPGALAFRLPFGSRERRAALAVEERGFWQVVISLALSHAVVLGLAAAGRYSFTRLLVADALLCAAFVAIARFRLRLGAAKPTAATLIVLALAALAASRFFPPSEYIIGGKDPGSYVNEGILIAQRGTLVYEDPTVASVPPFARDLFFPSHQRPDYYGTRFMGFFLQDPETGRVVGQFPHLLPASIAIAYGIDGLTGARRAVGVWAVLGVVAVYLAGARWIGRTAAGAAAALLALNVVEVWYGRYPNAEVVMQALLFAALLANARAHFDSAGRDAFFGTLAGTLLGLLLFLRFDAVLAIGAVVGANLLAVVLGRRMTAAFVAALAITTALAAVYLVGPMRAYSTYPIEFVKFLPWWQRSLLIAAAAAGAALLAVARRQPGIRTVLERALPAVLVLVVWGLAIYAFFFRTPEGKLAAENAYALRMYAAFYVTVPCLMAALAGYALVARRRFWDDPALILTITIFSVFFFYKIRIHAEHFWAARRYLPVILPGTLLLASAAATWGLAQPSRVRRVVSGTLGLVFLGLLAAQFARASAPIVDHVEYAGVIPVLETLAGQIGDRDLLLVEARDAGSDAHVFAVPLAYIYDRRVLALHSAAPDLPAAGAFLEWARTRYDRVLFLGGGGTALLSRGWTAVYLTSARVEAPEYMTAFNAYPRGVRAKKFDYGLYELRPRREGNDAPFDLDVGLRDDLHVLRFHAKETASDRTMRWTQDQSFVSVTTLPPSAREVVLTMSNGGRPGGQPPADVSVYLDDRLVGRATVEDGFRPYAFTLPDGLAATLAASNTPARLAIRTAVWRPSEVLGGSDDRELGVMVDRVQVR